MQDRIHQAKSENYLRSGFRELEEELEAVSEVMGEALPIADELRHLVPWRGNEESWPESIPAESAMEAAELFSISFELLNIVEERVAWRFRGWRRKEYGTDSIRGLWPSVLGQMREQGLGEEEALAALKTMRVQPVLTAHPTEAKRPEVRERHLAIYRALGEWEEAKDRDPNWVRRLADTLRAELETLWFAGEIHIKRPTIQAELRNAIYYLRKVLPPAVLRMDSSLELAWEDIGWDPESLERAGAYPDISFATWIGGDRDGHPFVTVDVTRGSFRTLRNQALKLHDFWLGNAAENLAHRPPFIECSGAIEELISNLTRELGETGAALNARNGSMPWRNLLYLIREKVNATRAGAGQGYEGVSDYLCDLRLAEQSMTEAGAGRAAREWLRPLVRLAEVFGFHLAALDIRQNSSFHDQAMTQLLVQAGVKGGEKFAEMSEPERREVLLAELKNPRTMTLPTSELEEEAAQVVNCYRLVRQQIEDHGAVTVGQLIVSMTRDVSDLLAVHVFAKEAGLASFEDGIWKSQVPVSPLFETGDDLARSGRVLDEYTEVIGFAAGNVLPAMVGYSDSNKDRGVFASQWGIHEGQRIMSEVCHRKGLVPQFFHGRGGTIGRGAGPTEWFLKALPARSLSGPIRVTEQGEVLPRKYAHEGNAHYHLELLVAGVAGAVASHDLRHEMAAEHCRAFELLRDYSGEKYRELFESEGFGEFHRAATPIDALEAGKFGSRPARRTGRSTLADLRAIPWVFSWTQSRFYLPGWFGVGTALVTLRDQEPKLYEQLLKDMNDIPFFKYVLTNVETSLASANWELMQQYAALFDHVAKREEILGQIKDELDRTRSEISGILGSDFQHRRPRMSKTLEMREQPLKLLHHQQIRLLKEWREMGRTVEGDAEGFHPHYLSLQLTINAISSGLRETG